MHTHSTKYISKVRYSDEGTKKMTKTNFVHFPIYKICGRNVAMPQSTAINKSPEYDQMKKKTREINPNNSIYCEQNSFRS